MPSFGPQRHPTAPETCSLGPNGTLRRPRRRSHAVDQPLDPLVVGPERVLAQHGPLGLVVELQMYPVDGEVTTPLLGLADELAAEPSPGGLGRHGLGLE